jgi:hypothetical protein
MAWSLNEPDIEALTREALNLLSLEIDELYTVLGCQLLATAPPTRTAGIITHVRELRTANSARRQAGTPASEAALNEWTNGVEAICRDLRGDGAKFIEIMRQEFKKGLCKKDIFDLADDVDESKMQILIMIISAIIKVPAQFESISATLAAMLCKSLLKEICR